jgi:hypothetical protein
LTYFLESFPFDIRDSLRNDILTPHHNLQGIMAKKYFSNKRNTVISNVTRDDQLVVLESMVQPMASQWLLALPNPGLSQVMTPSEFRAAIAVRLLIPQMASAKSCVAIGCPGLMDSFVYHTFTCGGGKAI